jgi:hypothetical protein
MDGFDAGCQTGPAWHIPNVATDTKYTISCSADCHIGAYKISKGETLNVISDADGLFSVYVLWGEGAISRMTAIEINNLAGWDITGIRQSPKGLMGGEQ